MSAGLQIDLAAGLHGSTQGGGEMTLFPVPGGPRKLDELVALDEVDWASAQDPVFVERKLARASKPASF